MMRVLGVRNRVLSLEMYEILETAIKEYSVACTKLAGKLTECAYVTENHLLKLYQKAMSHALKIFEALVLNSYGDILEYGANSVEVQQYKDVLVQTLEEQLEHWKLQNSSKQIDFLVQTQETLVKEYEQLMTQISCKSMTVARRQRFSEEVIAVLLQQYQKNVGNLQSEMTSVEHYYFENFKTNLQVCKEKLFNAVSSTENSNAQHETPKPIVRKRIFNQSGTGEKKHLPENLSEEMPRAGVPNESICAEHNHEISLNNLLETLTNEHNKFLMGHLESQTNLENLHQQNLTKILSSFESQAQALTNSQLSCQQYTLLATNLQKVFSSNLLKQENMLYEQNQTVIDQIESSYKAALQDQMTIVASQQELFDFENQLRNGKIRELQNKVKNFTRYKSNLEASLNRIFDGIRQEHTSRLRQISLELNTLKLKSKEMYNTTMGDFVKGDINVEELQAKHNETKNAVVTQLIHNSNSLKFSEICKTQVGAIYELLDLQYEAVLSRFDQSKLTREQAQQLVLCQIVQHYEREMTTCMQGTLYIEPQDLERLHDHVVQATLEKFKEKSNINPSKVQSELQKSFVKFQNENEMNSYEDPAIGIDLGTTFCCMSVYSKGKLNIIPNSLRESTTPSYVLVDVVKNIKVVGSPAKERAYENPESTIFDSKRLIGRYFSDSEVQEDIKLWPFEVTDDGKNIPVVSINNKTYHPEAISAMILAKLKHDAERYLGRRVSKAVITVPAYFGDSQREATVVAGRIAGLQVLSILNEPVAAALAYNLQHPIVGNAKKERKILIFDLGGGTFDVAVAKAIQGNIEILSVGGDPHLGGEDFDRKLMEYCAQEFEKVTNINLFEGMDSPNKTTRDDARRRIKRLQRECEKTKILLSTSMSVVDVTVDRITEDKDLIVSLSRSQFEQVNKDLFDRTLGIVQQTLKESKTKICDIEDIVLVGGSTRIPKIQQMLHALFAGKELRKNINPDEAVAQGAGLLAAILKGHVAKESMDYTQIRDITSLPIGIQTIYDRFSVIIPKGTKIPVTLSDDFFTTSNDQIHMNIVVYEGENKIASLNRKLGEFMLGGIPPKPAGKEKAIVEMNMTSQGILHVSAKSIGSGKTSQLTIKENKQRLDEETIAKYIEEMSSDAQANQEFNNDSKCSIT